MEKGHSFRGNVSQFPDFYGTVITRAEQRFPVRRKPQICDLASMCRPPPKCDSEGRTSAEVQQVNLASAAPQGRVLSIRTAGGGIYAFAHFRRPLDMFTGIVAADLFGISTTHYETGIGGQVHREQLVSRSSHFFRMQ